MNLTEPLWPALQSTVAGAVEVPGAENSGLMATGV
jgi:hypothetical protein